jgi:SRSO17 transposase
MTPDEVRGAAHELHTLHQRFAPYFGTSAAQGHALTYLRGLLLHDGRKNTEAIVLSTTEQSVRPLQQFLSDSPWDYRIVQQQIQADFAADFIPSTTSWDLGTVGVLDESGFPKKGVHSVGVARQWCGRLGKKDNCQVGVYLIGVTPAGCALLDHQLYLPEDWVVDRERRQGVGVPRSVVFRTKPQLGLDLHERVRTAGHVKFDWLTFDELYGRNEEFLYQLERRRQNYVGEIPVSTTVWTADPATQIPPYCGRGREPRRPARDSVRTVAEVGVAVPAEAWRVLCLREGSGEPVAFEFARVRVWAMRDGGPGPAIWLLLRRPVGGEGEVKYYVSNAGEETTLETLALVSGCRHRVEEYFGDGKGLLGMGHYEVRSWAGWHHHMTLVALAHLLVTRVCVRLKKNERVDVGSGSASSQSGLTQADTDSRRDDGVSGILCRSECGGATIAYQEVAAAAPRNRNRAVIPAGLRLKELARWAN